ncbi:MAG: hypothetical protein JF599_04555 [Verrucomicrobia bacterium]|nr:hypothetical protein [Verrucomicrobiota bacterium]
MSDSSHRLLRYFRRAGAGSLLISLIVHVILIGAATVYVVSTVREQRKASFQGGSGNPSPGRQDVQHKVQMAKQQQNLSAVTQRLAVDSPNASVSLPDLPDMPGFSGGGPATGNLGGSGGGSGAGVGSPRAPLMPFGFREPQPGGSLVGHLYDLKQLTTRKPNPLLQKMLATLKGIAPYDELITKEVGAFIQSNSKSAYLDAKFYRSPNPLYTTQIFVPDTPADEAPKAYGAEQTVQPKCWIAHYRGRVSPPTTGIYRFVGGADDVMVVRLDGRLVLDGGIVNVSNFKTDRPQKPNYPYDFAPKNAMGIPFLNQRRGGFVVGKRMDLRAGLVYDLDIIIGESPGGFFFANLLVEKEGDTYSKDAKGNPILPIFRVADAPPPAKDQKTSPYQENGPVWRALPVPQD